MGFQRGSPPLARVKGRGAPCGVRGRAPIAPKVQQNRRSQIPRKNAHEKLTSKLRKQSKSPILLCERATRFSHKECSAAPRTTPHFACYGTDIACTRLRLVPSSCVYRTIREYFFQRYFVSVAVLRKGVRSLSFAALSAFADEMI